MDIIFSQHSLQQMFKSNITVEQVKRAVKMGDEIKDYPDDKPYPSKLLLSIENELPLHVVAAYIYAENKCIIITAYNPDINLWSDNFKKRR